MRTAFDFSPLYQSMIGVDRMADLIDAATRRVDDNSNYPPCNIEKTGENTYRISVATAGFRPDELEITAQPNMLIVAGQKPDDAEGRLYLHRGIPARAFERKFELADYVVVKSADLRDGVLSIELAREVPDALKPRRVEIATAVEQPQARIKDQPKAA